MTKNYRILLLMLCLSSIKIQAQQNVGIGTSSPHNSALLDINSNNKGVLIPRVNLLSETDVVTITGPLLSLLVYNSNNTLPDGEGFYFWNGAKWSKLTTRTNLENLSWGTSGNTGTNVNTHFIGTTDNKALVFKTNNILSGKIEPANNNTYWGQSAGLNVTTGQNNSLFGQSAGSGLTTGNGNLFAGHNAGQMTTEGVDNTFIGQGAGKNNSFGNSNVFVGETSGLNNLVDETTGVGAKALQSNQTGKYNTAVGFKSLFSSTSSSSNTAIGYLALKFCISDDNTAVGAEALSELITGARNTALGNRSLANNSAGNSNTATGNTALNFNSNGSFNSAFGDKAMYFNESGNFNSAFGWSSLTSNISGFQNTAVGYYSMQANTDGYDNIAIGSFSLANNVSGFKNSAVGYNALTQNLTGDLNTAIGNNSGPSLLLTSLNNTTAIGANARVSTSNTMAFGDVNVDRWAFGITTTTAQHALEVGNAATNGNGAFLTQGGTWTNTSDMNKKEDFSDLDTEQLMKKISELKIQKWRYKETNEYHIGPVAQQFYQLFQLGEDEKGISTIDPAGIALAAIQQLIKENDSLKKRIEILEQIVLRKN